MHAHGCCGTGRPGFSTGVAGSIRRPHHTQEGFGVGSNQECDQSFAPHPGVGFPVILLESQGVSDDKAWSMRTVDRGLDGEDASWGRGAH